MRIYFEKTSVYLQNLVILESSTTKQAANVISDVQEAPIRMRLVAAGRSVNSAQRITCRTRTVQLLDVTVSLELFSRW